MPTPFLPFAAVTDTVLQSSFDDDLICHEGNYSVSARVTQDLQSISFPTQFRQYPHLATWAKQEQACINSIFSVISRAEIAQIGDDTGTLIQPDLAGKLVHIGGYDQEAVERTQQKLDVLLEARVS
jgi:hypothetical protein